MNADEFVWVLNAVVKDAAVEDTISILKSPPGKKPSKELVDLSDFYNNQTDENKDIINKIINRVADYSLFGVLCVLDGVRAIEDDGDKGELILTYQKNNTPSIVLNEHKNLHDIYNSN
ncbi:TPA: hypothetical protein I8190_005618 [Citrobacter freundii]|uniref:hypothetical protein n=1 Tax=Citrobacter farmeri TaxID=67824 RepID=UPI001A31A4F0|nr:hypothetical protein [Citrobacter farmeri]HAT2288010.1 hypothetical protein [Citrobacter freundii]ELR9638778.1 hypothetical protein [Citrobacter farmeri]MEC3929594.1 hypothetical protein [Citrobacter farmeri]HAT2288647.1 hypothetical protein [Citrobacter freundii]HAT2351657.1 hypothetical protein [Citrobacter freundii]